MTDAAVEEPRMVCPKCNEPLNFAVVAKVMDQHRYSFQFRPGDGLFSTKTVGGLIAQIGKFGNSVCADIGFKAQTLVERIETAEDGTITVHLITSLVKPNSPTLPKQGGSAG